MNEVLRRAAEYSFLWEDKTGKFVLVDWGDMISCVSLSGDMDFFIEDNELYEFIINRMRAEGVEVISEEDLPGRLKSWEELHEAR